MNQNTMNHPLKDALWIGGERECVSPVILRRFIGRRVKKATLHITGLGWFEAKLNGQPVSQDWFQPLLTDYEARDMSKFNYPLFDHLTHRTYYCTYDVTDLVKDGENCLSVQLGNGWYRQTERIAEGNMVFGQDLKTIYSLVMEIPEGELRLNSDGSEVWKSSEIVYSNLFIGEVVDTAAADGEEKPVRVLPAPESVLCPQIGTPDRLIRTITPVCIGAVDGKQIYDAGENISGVVQIRTSAPQGEKVTLRFAENLNSDLTLNFDSTGGDHICTSGRPQIMEDVFVSDGTERIYVPKFVWHAFRYFEVDGQIDDAQVLVIHSDTPVTSSFSSSSEGLNYLYETFVRTQLNNMHGSIPSDCPHRERLGYTGDGQICAPAVMLMMDSREFYRKWIRDILDCQDPVTGHVQHTAPLMGGGGGPGGWGCAIVLVPYAYYKQYGEREMLEQCWEPMLRWVAYLENHSEDGLVVREEDKGWCLGDWCTLEPIKLPEPYVNSCYFVKVLQMLREVARVLNRDEVELEKLENKATEAIRKTYWNPETGSYCDGVQGADAYGLWIGLGGQTEADHLAKKYDQLGHFDTGFLCTDILMEMLFQYGHADTALKLLESEELGSYLYMKRHGATTIWENWNSKSSHDHPMFGACVRQLFQSVLGIRWQGDWRKLTIAPQIPRNLAWAEGSVQLPVGEVAVSWHQENTGIRLQVTLPEDVRALCEIAGRTVELTAGMNELYMES